MPAQITPVQKQDPLAKLLPIGGAVVGGLTAGPGGALAGASTGASLGGTAAGFVQKDPVQTVEADGMSRRQQSLGADPAAQIRQAQAQLAQLPPDQLPETRRALENALAFAQRNQQIGRGQV